MKKKFFNVLLLVLVMCISSTLVMAEGNQAQDKLLAKRAAIADAQRNLVEIIYGIQVDAGTSVKESITKDDAIRGRVNGFINNAEIVYESYENGIYQVKLRIDTENLKKLLGEKIKYTERFIEAAGKGASPNYSKDDSSSKKDSKPWYSQVIKANGAGTIPNDPSLGKDQKLLMAERAAKLDAYRNLIEKIKGVHIDAQTTVQRFITENDTIMTEIQAFVQGAEVIKSYRVVEKGKETDKYEVIVKIELDGLKNIIKQQAVR